MLRHLTLVLVLALAAAPAAAAQEGAALERAARSLPVYVDPAMLGIVTAAQADALRTQIADAGGQIYVAVVPDGPESAEEALEAYASRVDRPGTYVVVEGDDLLAAANGGPEEDDVARLADEAFADHRAEGTAGIAPALSEVVAGVGDAREGDDDDSGGGSWFGGLFFWVAAIFAAVLGFSFLRRRGRTATAFRDVRATAEEDLLALGDDIRALDLDVELPGADAQGKEDYARAVDSYDRASRAFDRARRPSELAGVSAALEEGRWAMASAKARLAGEEPPERRQPCFFDPRHGPSVRDVGWAPPGGEPRPVPACAADALRVEEGEEPESRAVLVGGRRRPYWSAGPAYAPFAGGFFGGATGALVPALFVSTLAGTGFGWGDDVGDGFDDIGGGDFGGGDFGGFGGGDFGGGDFGGGGGDGGGGGF